MSRPSICFLNPPHPYLIQPKAQAPLGMLYVAASVRKAGFDVKFVDLSDKQYGDDFNLPEADIYGITGTILDVKSIHVVARQIKKNNKWSKIIVGGPVSLSPAHLDAELVDSILIGEGEIEIFNVLEDYPRLKSFYKADRITDLDSLEFPARDLLGTHLGGNVFARYQKYYEGGSTVISMSRGCPFDCTFCASPRIWGRRIIHRSAESVAAEIDEVAERYGVRQLRFSDDNMTCDRDKLESLCRHLLGKKIAWRASIRVRPNDVDMFKMMKNAGCVEVCFGIESGDPNVLHTLHKKATVKENRIAIMNAKEAGLVVRILFMIGTPGETVKTVDRNIEFLNSVDKHYDTIAITNFTPLPGTAVADDPGSNDCEILCYDVDKYNLCLYGPDGKHNEWENHIRPFGLTLEQLTENKKRMVKFIMETGRSNNG